MLTDFSALPNSAKRVWSARVWKQGRDNSFWYGSNGLMGKGSDDTNSPVQLVTDLQEVTGGFQVVMHLVKDLQSDGVVGDNELEGNEEGLGGDTIIITIDQLRNGVKNAGRMSEQKTVLKFRANARDTLGFWLGDRLDQLAFLTAAGMTYNLNLDGSARAAASQWPSFNFAGDVTAPTSARKSFPNGNLSTATLTTGDKMSWDFLVTLRAQAERQRIKPIRAGGQMSYIVVMTPEQARDLKQDANYKTILAQGAARGPTNPLFKGEFAQVDGLVLYSHNKVPTNYGATLKWGAGNAVAGGQALLLGAQALGFARIGEAEWEESDNTDYKNRMGIKYGRLIGFKKPVFSSPYNNNTAQDFGVISAYTASLQ